MIAVAPQRRAAEGVAVLGLEPLVGVAATLAGGTQAEAAATAARLLAAPPPGGAIPRTRSTLNNDGSPLQVCLTAATGGAGVRLLADPGSHATSPPERVAIARETLARLLAQPGHESLRDRCEALLDAVTPGPLEAEPAALNGVLWLGAPIRGAGLAVYVKASWRSPAEDWDRCAELVERLLPDPAGARALIERLRGQARPVSAGLELSSRGGRLKLYWRLGAEVPLAAAGVDLLADASLRAFAHATIGERRVAAQGLVPSAGFSLESGALCDAKLDICGHCVPRAPRDWSELIASLSAAHQLDAPPLDEVLRAGRAEVAFLGFGLDRAAGPRLNVYLKRATRGDR